MTRLALMLAAGALVLAALPAKADKAIIPPELRGVWCLDHTTDPDTWGIYTRTGCRGDEVELVYWLKLYANGDYRTMATYCKAVSKPDSHEWIRYRCTREGVRKRLIRSNKFQSDDLGVTMYQGGFEQ